MYITKIAFDREEGVCPIPGDRADTRWTEVKGNGSNENGEKKTRAKKTEVKGTEVKGTEVKGTEVKEIADKGSRCISVGEIEEVFEGKK